MSLKQFLAAMPKSAGVSGFLATAATVVPWIALAVVSGQLITVLFGALLGVAVLALVSARYCEGVIDGINGVISDRYGPSWRELFQGDTDE